MKSVILKIYRYDVDQDPSPRFQLYTIPVKEKITLLMALQYIYEHIDNTLAFRNYCCGAGPLCGSCLLIVDGKTTYACNFPLKGDQKLTVEPPRGFPIIKDLVVDWGVSLISSNGHIWNIKKGAFVTGKSRFKVL